MFHLLIVCRLFVTSGALVGPSRIGLASAKTIPEAVQATVQILPHRTEMALKAAAMGLAAVEVQATAAAAMVVAAATAHNRPKPWSGHRTRAPAAVALRTFLHGRVKAEKKRRLVVQDAVSAQRGTQPTKGAGAVWTRIGTCPMIRYVC